MTKTVVVTGAKGQLGSELARTVPYGINLILLDKNDLDITDSEMVSEYLNTTRPDWVINAAAYTAVDKAESEKQLAYLINEKGVENLAVAASKSGARLLQVSTDFVFDGNKNTSYDIQDKPDPINIYGSSKLAGEKAALSTLGGKATVVRTSWLYSSFGHNFVKTMLRLMAEKDELNIVSDQLGTPTWAKGLAEYIWFIIANELNGVRHWSDQGVASWYDFAVAIYDEAKMIGLLTTDCKINPIPSSSYPCPAKRPQFSVLAKTSPVPHNQLYHWRESLRNMLGELKV